MVRLNPTILLVLVLTIQLITPVMTDDSYPLIVIDRAKDIKILDAGTYINSDDNIFSSELVPNQSNENGEFTYITG